MDRTEIKKVNGSASSNNPGATIDFMYRIQLCSEVVKCIGGSECIVIRSETGFKITPNNYGVLSVVKRPSRITKQFTLNIPKRLVDAWSDLCEYEIEYDYENNCVILIKVVC